MLQTAVTVWNYSLILIFIITSITKMSTGITIVFIIYIKTIPFFWCFPIFMFFFIAKAKPPEILLRRSALLYNLQKNKDRKNNTNQGIQTDYGSQQAEDDSNQRDLRQQADHKTTDKINKYVDNLSYCLCLAFRGFECVGIEIFQHFHFNY